MAQRVKVAGDRILARRLTDIMGQRRILARELAEAAGVSRHAIYTMRTARNSVGIHNVRKVKDALECSWEDLLGP